jgi:hypothetical protein
MSRLFTTPGGLKLKTVQWLYKSVVGTMLIYMVVGWWPRVCLATVRADLGHLQRLADASIKGSVSTAPWILFRYSLVFCSFIQ